MTSAGAGIGAKAAAVVAVLALAGAGAAASGVVPLPARADSKPTAQIRTPPVSPPTMASAVPREPRPGALISRCLTTRSTATTPHKSRKKPKKQDAQALGDADSARERGERDADADHHDRDGPDSVGRCDARAAPGGDDSAPLGAGVAAQQRVQRGRRLSRLQL